MYWRAEREDAVELARRYGVDRPAAHFFSQHVVPPAALLRVERHHVVPPLAEQVLHRVGVFAVAGEHEEDAQRLRRRRLRLARLSLGAAAGPPGSELGCRAPTGAAFLPSEGMVVTLAGAPTGARAEMDDDRRHTSQRNSSCNTEVC